MSAYYNEFDPLKAEVTVRPNQRHRGDPLTESAKFPLTMAEAAPRLYSLMKDCGTANYAARMRGWTREDLLQLRAEVKLFHDTVREGIREAATDQAEMLRRGISSTVMTMCRNEALSEVGTFVAYVEACIDFQLAYPEVQA